MLPAAVLKVIVGAEGIGPTNAKLASVQGNLTKTASVAQTAGRRTAAGLKYASAGALAVGFAAGKLAFDFENSLEKVVNLVGIQRSQVKEWGDDLLELAPKVGKSPKELADALYFVSSSGIKVNKVLATTKVAAQASALGLGETETVADALTSAMNAYAKSGLTAKDATNVLIETVKFGKLEADELAQSIGRVIPVSSKLKIPFNDVGAALAAMSLQGLDAAEATTALRGIFTSFLKPTDDAEKALKSIGLSAAEMRDVLAKKGTLGALSLLTERFKGNEEQIARVFPNVRALVGAFNLTGESGKRNAQIFQEMGGNTDDLGKSWERFSQTPAQQMRMAVSGIQAALTKLGEKILPVAADALTRVVDIVTDKKLTTDQKFTKLTNLISDSIADIAPEAAAAGGKVGLAILKGIARSWLDANPLEKLIIGAGIIRLVGGRGALLGAGKKLGGVLGLGIAQGAATGGVTGGAAGGIGGGAAAGGVAGSIATGWKGKLATVGKRLGWFALGYGLLSGVGTAIDAQSSERTLPGPKIRKWLAPINDTFVGAGRAFGINLGQTSAAEAAAAFADKWGQRMKFTLAGGVGLTGGFKGFGSGIIDRSAAAKAAKATEGTLQAAFRRVSAKEQFADVWGDLQPDEKKIARAVNNAVNAANKLASRHGVVIPIDRIEADPKAAQKGAQAITRSLDFLKGGAAASIGDVNRVVSRGMRGIASSMGLQSKQGRKATAEQFRQAAVAIKHGMDKGWINAKKGSAKIKDLLRSAKIADPTKDQARQMGRSWSKALDRTDEVTKRGVQRLLDNLGKIPPAARQIAAKTALNHLREARKEGDLSDKQYRKIKSTILSHFDEISRGGKTKTFQLAKAVGKNTAALVNVVGSGLGINKDNLNQALGAFNVKPVKYVIKQMGKALGLQAGGFVVPGYSTGDKHPMHIDGKHVADVESREIVHVTNRKRAAALEAGNRINPRFGGGPAKAATAGNARGFAEGGLAFALGPYTIPPIKFDPDHAGGNSHVHISGSPPSWVVQTGKSLQKMGFLVGENPAFGGVTSSNHAHYGALDHYHGGAIDVNSAKHLQETVQEVTQIANLLKGKGGMAGAVTQLKKLLLKGTPGPMLDQGQKILDKSRGAAQTYLNSKAGNENTGVVGGALKGGRTVASSWYQPDQFTGTVGYRGDSLPGKMAYAELDMGTALGGLPHGAKLQIGYHGRSVVGEKLDIGAGGGGLGGYPRAIDLWVDLADALHFNKSKGIDLVQVKQAARGLTLAAGGKAVKLAAGGSPHGEAGPSEGGRGQSGGRGHGGGLGIGRVLQAIGQREGAKKPLNRLLDRVKDLGVGDKLQAKIKRLSGLAGDEEEFAQRAGTLSGDGAQAKVLGRTEAQWLQRALGHLFKLRNQLIHAHQQLARHRDQVEKALKDAKRKTHDLQVTIKHGDRDQRKLQRELDAEQKKPKKEQDPKRIKKLQRMIEALKDKRGPARKLAALKDKITPGLRDEGSKLKGKDQSLRDLLEEIQGRGSSMRVLGRLPELGAFGGRILDAQMRLKELNAPAGAADTAATAASFFDFLKLVGPGNVLGQYAGAFATGGVVRANPWALVGEKGPELARFPTGTKIHDASESAGMLSGDVNVEVIIHGSIVSDAADPVEAVIGDRRFKAKVTELHERRDKDAERSANRGSNLTR